jgi:hypothetical protein
MRALFDADILVFRCGFAAERNQWFLKVGDGHEQQFQYKKEALVALDEQLPGKMSREAGKDYSLWSERFVEPVEHALHNVNITVNRALENLGLTEWDVTMYLSGGKNYRYDIAKTKPYKGNRDKEHRPTHEAAIKDHIRRTWNTVVTNGIEADDALGIAQCEADEHTTVIVSQDKDLTMIPGLHYDFVEDEGFSVTEEQGLRNFYEQLLKGDPTDNIPGLPKIGTVKAKKAFEGVPQDEWWHVVKTMYQAHSPKADWEGYLKEQGQLLWIMRERDTVWEPPIEDNDEPTEVSLF